MDNRAALARLIADARRVAVFTGAGISTESGVPDFRSPGGVWSKMKPIYFQEFVASEDKRREAWTRTFKGSAGWTGAKPNAGHLAVARLVAEGKVASIITQNVDNLHQDSGVPPEQVIEVHGNASYAKCLECGLRHEFADLKPAFVERGEIPACRACGGVVKSATISFGQSMPELEMARAEAEALACDLFLVLGSSLVVYPAAGLPILAKRHGAALAIVNREPTEHDPLADLVMHDEIGPALTAVVGANDGAVSLIRSLSFWVLVALAAGIAAGAAVNAAGGPTAKAAVETVEAFGGLWLNALRMTIVPLVLSLLVAGVAATADAASTGRLAARAAVLFLVLLFAAAIYSTLVSSGLLALWPADPQGAAALQAGAAGGEPLAATAPDFREWLKSLAPANPIKAAAEDAILPLVVFGLFLGFAVTRLPTDLAETLLKVFQATAEAMIVIVRWVLLAAPAGVFALALGVGMRAGLGATGVLVHYVIFVAAITLGITVLGFFVGVVGGRLSPMTFARAATPVWAVAFSTQSSLASLPAMVERSQDVLGVPERVTGVVLPLAVAVFRLTSPVANLAAAYFVAHLSGVEPTPLQMLGGVFVAVAISIGSVGLPGQISFFASMAPICLALGAPIELLPILLAVEVVPDIFRTLGNVTGDMAVTVTLNRSQPAVGEPPPA